MSERNDDLEAPHCPICGTAMQVSPFGWLYCPTDGFDGETGSDDDDEGDVFGAGLCEFEALLGPGEGPLIAPGRIGRRRRSLTDIARRRAADAAWAADVQAAYERAYAADHGGHRHFVVEAPDGFALRVFGDPEMPAETLEALIAAGRAMHNARRGRAGRK